MCAFQLGQVDASVGLSTALDQSGMSTDPSRLQRSPS